MERRPASLIARTLLVAGFLVALAIYFTAAAGPDRRGRYDPLAEKKYLRQLERIGGKANVVSAELQAWFDGLWHGRPLAGTVAVLTVVGAGTFWFLATLPPHPDDDPPAAPTPRAPRR